MQPAQISNQRPVPSLAGLGALLFRCCSGRQNAVFAAKNSGTDAWKSLKNRQLVVFAIPREPWGSGGREFEFRRPDFPRPRFNNDLSDRGFL